MFHSGGRDYPYFWNKMSSPIIGPIPPYNNPPIEPQFYQPSRFYISGITRGRTTIITTSEDNNYVIGQLVRLIIPSIFGSYQLNERTGYVISIISNTQVVLDLDSTQSDAFIPSPYAADITNITNTFPAIITANNSFKLGNVLQIYDVSGMTQMNDKVGNIISSNSTTISINIDATAFSTYLSGGISKLFNVPQNQAEILAIGDISSGQTNFGRTNNLTYIPGSFINISPL